MLRLTNMMLRLGRGVVRLAVIAEQANLRAGHDDAGVLRLARLLALVLPVVAGEVRGREAALAVHLEDQVPLGLAHVEHRAVAQDAGHVYDTVDTTEFIDALGDHALSAVSSCN